MTDPTQQKLKQRRLLTWILFIPWAISLYFMMQQQKRMAERTALEQKTAVAGSPIDEIVKEPDLRTRISALEQYLETNKKGPDAQRAEMLVAVACEAQGAASAEAFSDWSPYQRAADAYEAFFRNHRASPWAAHAEFRAGSIYLDHIPDGAKKGVKLLGSLSFENRSVWVPPDDGSKLWVEKPALQVAGALIEPHMRGDLRYRLIDRLVSLFGGKTARSSYVFALIALAVIVKVVLLPLGIRSHIAMKTMQAKMAAIQPAIDEIKKRHKDDQMKLMQEQSRLMKENGVSMTGGCLPQLIQLPFLIYVYYAVKLYAHHFANGGALWIADLSRPDLPLLVIYAASMILSMKLTPQAPSADSQQKQTQKMMTYLMPVMMVMFLKSWPSAFIFYWATFNIFATVQQLWLNKRFPGPALAVAGAGGGSIPMRVSKPERDAIVTAKPSSDGPRSQPGILARILGVPSNTPSGNGRTQPGDRKPVRARGKTRTTRRRKPPSTGPGLPPPRMR